MHYFGAYSSRARARRNAEALKVEANPIDREEIASPNEPKLTPKKRAALGRRRANLRKRVFKTDPLLCQCGGTFRLLSFITESKVVRKILVHLQNRQNPLTGSSRRLHSYSAFIARAESASSVLNASIVLRFPSTAHASPKCLHDGDHARTKTVFSESHGSMTSRLTPSRFFRFKYATASRRSWLEYRRPTPCRDCLPVPAPERT